MKTNLTFSILILSMFALSSCLERTTSSKSSGSSGGGSFNNDSGTGDTGGTGSTGGTGGGGSACAGSSSDGDGSGNHSLRQFDITLAGHQTWTPGTDYNGDGLVPTTSISLYEANMLFQSDTRYKARFKIHPQPSPVAGEEYCYGRTTSSASLPDYTKLRLRINLRDIKCDTPDPDNTNKCSSGFYLGSAYYTKVLDPVSTNSCSPIVDLGSLRSHSDYGSVIEVTDVKDDVTCQYNGDKCPAEQIVRSATCWSVTMQVSTDFTDDFK